MTTKTGEAILTSMASVQEELDAIKKDQKGFGYKFRGIDQVLNALNPLFKKHKIITTRRNLVATRNIRPVVGKDSKTKDFIEVEMKAEYVFKSLVDGSEIVSEGFGEGQDSSGGDKASSMATSNSYKYVIFEMFNIATEEQKDSDQVTAETNTSTSFSKKSTTTAKDTVAKTEEVATVTPRRGRATVTTAEKVEVKQEVIADSQSTETPERSFRLRKS